MVSVERRMAAAGGDLFLAQSCCLVVAAGCFQGGGLDGNNMVVSCTFWGHLHFSQKFAEGFLIFAGDGGMAIVGPVLGKTGVYTSCLPEQLQRLLVLRAKQSSSAFPQKAHGPVIVRADL